MRVEASEVLIGPPEDAWALVGEPYHLPDWWPGYLDLQLDRRGLAEGARWTVHRGPTSSGASNLSRRADGWGTLVITRVVPGRVFAWHDVDLRIDCRVELEPAAERRTLARVSVEGSWARLGLEGLRPVPRHACRRLHDLCQTAASL